MANNQQPLEEGRDITQLDPLDFTPTVLLLGTDENGKTGQMQGQAVVDQVQSQVESSGLVAEQVVQAQAAAASAGVLVDQATTIINTGVRPKKYQGLWNAATNTPNLVGLALANTEENRGKTWQVSVAGSGYAVNDYATFNGTTFDKSTPTSNLIDPKNSPNLIASANSSPENWSLLSSGGYPRFYRQTGTAVVSIVKNVKRLGFWGKAIIQPSGRVNFVSNEIPLEALPVGSQIEIGYFRYTKPGTLLDGATNTQLVKQSGGGTNTLTTENLDLGNGMVYVRTTAPFTVPSYTVSIQLAMNIYASASTPADSEVWIGSPTLIVTDLPLAPAMYLGPEIVDYTPFTTKTDALTDGTKLRTNRIKDVNFASQPLGATVLKTPWTALSGGSNFLATFLFEAVADGPTGNKAIKVIHKRRSSDSLLSDFQFSQVVNIPAEYEQATKVSYGIWAKRSSLFIDIVASQVSFYTGLNGVGSNGSATPAPTGVTAVTDIWMYVRFDNVTIPANTKSIRPRVRTTALSGATPDADMFLWMQSPIVSFSSATANALNDNPYDIAERVSGEQFLLQATPPILPNGDFSIGTASHALVTGATFLPAYEVVTMDTPLGTATKALKLYNRKRSSDSLNSILRDYITTTFLAGVNSVLGMSFVWAGDFTKIKAFCQIEFRNDAGTISTTAAYDTLGTLLGTFGGLSWYRFPFSASIPSNATIARCTARIEGRDTMTPDTLYESFHTGMIASYLLTAPEFSKNFYSQMLGQLVADPAFYGPLGLVVSPTSKFGIEGKKICEYGTSISAAGVNTANVLQAGHEMALVATRFGATVRVRGVGSSRVVDNGQTAWFKNDASQELNGLYLGRPDAGDTEPVTPHYTYSAALSTAQRVSTIPTDTDIIIIETGTNDYVNYPLGDIYSAKDQNTFSGAFQLMMDLIIARIPNAEKIILIPAHRNGEDTAIGTGSATGVRFEALRELQRSLAKKYKVRTADMGKAGINQNNYADFEPDGIHPNSAGYERRYRVISETLKLTYAQ